MPASAIACRCLALLLVLLFAATGPAIAQMPRSLFDRTNDKETITAVAFSPDGKSIAAAGNFSEDFGSRFALKVRIYSVGGPFENSREKLGSPVLSIMFSPDSRSLATIHADGTANLWDAPSAMIRTPFQWPDGVIRCVAFSPNSKTVFLGGSLAQKDKAVGAVKVWDAVKRKELDTLAAHPVPVLAVAVSADGKLLATGAEDGHVKVWDLASKKELADIEAHAEGVLALAFAPDGKSLLSGSADKTAKLWDVSTGKEKALFVGHARPVTLVGFMADGKTLYTASREDETLRLWEEAMPDREKAVIKRIGWTASVAFSPEQKMLVGGGPNGLVLWEDVTKLLPQKPEKEKDKDKDKEKDK